MFACGFFACALRIDSKALAAFFLDSESAEVYCFAVGGTPAANLEDHRCAPPPVDAAGFPGAALLRRGGGGKFWAASDQGLPLRPEGAGYRLVLPPNDASYFAFSVGSAKTSCAD